MIGVQCLKEGWEEWCGGGNLGGPIRVAVGSDAIYVVEETRPGISCFSFSGALIRKWGKKGHDKDALDTPRGIAIGRTHRIDNRILEEIHQVVELHAFPPGLPQLCASYIGKEEVYVSDAGNHCIQVFNTSGEWNRRWGTKGSKDEELLYPQSCVWSDYFLYIKDAAGGIKMFTDQGTFVRILEHSRNVFAITAAEDGKIYAYDEVKKHIVSFSRDGDHYTLWYPRVWTTVFDLTVFNGRVYITSAANTFTTMPLSSSMTAESSHISCCYYWKTGRRAYGIASRAGGMLYIVDYYNGELLAVNVSNI